MSILTKLWPNLGRDLLFNSLFSSVVVPIQARWMLYRAAGMDVAKSRICPHVWFGNRNISIGAGTFINYRVRFNTAGGIIIGENCDIAMDVSFVTSTHEHGDAMRRAGKPIHTPINVGNGVWIGARAVILPGVSIGDGVVVAAGAVVTSDCAPHGVYAGVPARRVRELDRAVTGNMGGLNSTHE